MRNVFRIIIASFGSLILSLWAQAQDADPLEDNAQSCYAAYFAAMENPGLQANMASEWIDLADADFETRVNTVAPYIGGFASMMYAESYAGGVSQNLTAELLRYMRPAVLNAAVGRVAHCDEVYGIEPAIFPNSDAAFQTAYRQGLARMSTPEEIVACNQVYKAAEGNNGIRQSPMGALWANLADFDYGMRLFELELYADIANAYYNVPQNVAYPPEETSWAGKLSAALETQDLAAQQVYLEEVSLCDSAFDMPDTLVPGPMMAPEITHAECGARYTSLIPFYGQVPQTQAYFRQRSLHTANYVKLLAPNQPDQEILQALEASANTRVQSYLKEDGQPDPRRLMQAFDEVGQCDRQYGLSVTIPPEELHRAARMAD
ncbi:MAG: hypothetical protein MRY64_12945 [Hyphomonadaceae bacterium]|nr:hypothetical protein [Hyphomonadaceae bacterium]